MQKIGKQSTALTRAIECGGDCSKGAQGSSVCGEVAGERVACSSHAVPTVLISSATPGGNTGAEMAACSSKTNKAPRIIAKPPCVPRECEREVYPVTPQRRHLPKLSSQPPAVLGPQHILPNTSAPASTWKQAPNYKEAFPKSCWVASDPPAYGRTSPAHPTSQAKDPARTLQRGRWQSSARNKTQKAHWGFTGREQLPPIQRSTHGLDPTTATPSHLHQRPQSCPPWCEACLGIGSLLDGIVFRRQGKPANAREASQ